MRQQATRGILAERLLIQEILKIARSALVPVVLALQTVLEQAFAALRWRDLLVWVVPTWAAVFIVADLLVEKVCRGALLARIYVVKALQAVLV